MCARKFQYAESGYDVSLSYSSDNNKLKTLIEDNPCSKLNSNKYGGYTNWRVPNQKEISIMRNLGLITSSNTYVSCTQEYFDLYGYALGAYERRFLVATNTHTYALSPGSATVYVRCVRDVE